MKVGQEELKKYLTSVKDLNVSQIQEENISWRKISREENLSKVEGEINNVDKFYEIKVNIEQKIEEIFWKENTKRGLS